MTAATQPATPTRPTATSPQPRTHPLPSADPTPTGPAATGPAATGPTPTGPTPTDPTPTGPTVASPATGAQVLGVHCARGHFTDPTVAYCPTCGLSMLQATRTPVLGTRPPLGVLILHDGTTHPLTHDLELGREPGTGTTAGTGQVGHVRITDPTVSRRHARLELHDWQVRLVDTGSTNGTFISTPGNPTWTRLPPGEAVTLPPGAVAALGNHQIRYHSYRTC
jgi:hypothetical protein